MIKNFVKSIIFIIIFVLLFDKITYVLRNKEDIESIKPIWEEEKLDVIFLGASITNWGVYSMKLWKDYGIASYNAGYPMSYFSTNSYIIEEHIERFSPKVIMMDTADFHDIDVFNTTCFHKGVDNMPFCVNKLKCIFNSPEEYRIEGLFNIVAFHSRWKELTKEDFEYYGKSADKGTHYRTEKYEGDARISQIDDICEIPKTTEDYIKRVNQICLENDVKFIFVMYPTMNNEMHSIANGVIEICKENNIEFIDFYKLTEEIELNENEDMTDGFHFNISGAKKVTSYLGNYLIERGYVTDRRNDPEFVSWHEDYENSEYKKLYADS